MYFWHGKCKYDHLSDGFLCILYVFFIVNCLSSFEHGGLGAIGNVHPTPLLDPYCAPTLDTKDSNIRELGKIGSDKTKLYDPRPGFHLYSLLQTRLDEQSKQHEPAPFWILKLLLWRRLHQFFSIPSFHKSNAFFKHFKQNRVRAVYQ